jgi:ribonucleoside-diphosphate reductase alpha chain
MKFTRRFTTEGQDPFGDFRYETRRSAIRRADGRAESLSVEVPIDWSQTAADILAQKYLRRGDVPAEASRDESGTGAERPRPGAEGSRSGGSETSARQVVGRLAGCWRHWGRKLGYFDTEEDAGSFHDELVHMLLAQMAAPNSPQWFNTGLAWAYGIRGEPQGHFYVDPSDGGLKESEDAYTRPQPHACFIQSVEDDLLGDGGVYDLLAKEGRIFKYGSGTGTNFSTIRAEGEPLKGGGRSSGLMSFLKVFDRAAGAIKSGGTTRRAAKMVCLDLDHPEIEDFILWKSREEAKVAALAAGSRLLGRAQAGAGVDGSVPEGFLARLEGLAGQGIAPEPMPEFDLGFEGEAYATVSGQNANNSVRVPNRFLDAVESGGTWDLTARTDGRVLRTVDARKLWGMIGVAAWECADPGVQFPDTINEWHTCPKDGPIRASNPCSEYMFLDDTACNLASLNLARFQDADGTLRVDDFRHAVRLWTVVLDISVGMAQFPSRTIARRSFDYRTLGLGYANLGAFLMRAGIAYDSPEAAAWTGAVTALMGGAAYAASAELAAALGAFPRFAANREDMLRVVRNHSRAAFGDSPEGAGLGGFEGLAVRPAAPDPALCPPETLRAAREAWSEALRDGETWGFRNAQVTVLAPTGTIGLLMDCDTTGIEPDFALVKFKKLAGGGYLKIVNRSVPAALARLGYGTREAEAIARYCLGTGDLDSAPHVNTAELARRGLPPERIEAVKEALGSALSLADAFRGAGGADGMEALAALGFSPEQVEEADLAVCGAQTVEGAPFLDPAHYAVFDCANRCGRGTRSIPPSGHLRIMAAAQPFLSGAISKTVNLPSDATVADVQSVYRAARDAMIKAVALYRDGSKLSQPLTARKAKAAPRPATVTSAAPRPADEEARGPARKEGASGHPSPVPEHRPVRRRLPARRGGYVQEVVVSGHKLFLRTGEYPDGTLGEIFIDMYKEGAAYRGILNCFAVLASKALQYGVPLEELVDTFTFTRFEPAGPVDGHENIKNCTSILDLIFRILGLGYLGNTDFVHVKPAEASPPAAAGLNGCGAIASAPKGSAVLTLSGPAALAATAPQAQARARLAGYTGESCASCGSVRVRRNGTCVVCEDCGSTSGCS